MVNPPPLGWAWPAGPEVPVAIDLFNQQLPPPPAPAPGSEFMPRRTTVPRAASVVCGATCTYCIPPPPLNMLYMCGITKKTGEANMYPICVSDLTGFAVRCLASGASSTVLAAEDKVVAWGTSPCFGELGFGEKVGPHAARAAAMQRSTGPFASLRFVDQVERPGQFRRRLDDRLCLRCGDGGRAHAGHH